MLRIAIFSALLLNAWVTSGRAVAGTPLDRPTPPSCCADGVCYAHSGTHGWFPTRWRPWPGSVVPPPVPTPGVRDLPGVSPFETVPPEEEDRRAPPPTRGPAEDRPVETPVGDVPATVPITPREENGVEPVTPPFTRPALPDPTPILPIPRTTLPFGDGDSADLDPPPAPPFVRLARGQRAGALPIGVAGTVATHRLASQPDTLPPLRGSSKPSGDPPPALPLFSGAAY